MNTSEQGLRPATLILILIVLIGAFFLLARTIGLATSGPGFEDTPIVSTRTPFAVRTPTLFVVHTPTPFVVQTPTPIVIISPQPTFEPTLAIGALEIIHPKIIRVDDSDTLVVRITVNPRIAHLAAFSPGPGTFEIEERTQKGTRTIYTAKIQVYPVMKAEIQAPAFVVASAEVDGDDHRELGSGEPMAWAWTIQAKIVGEHTITVSLYQVTPSGNDLATEPIGLTVVTTDRPFGEKTAAFFSNNVVAIFSTGGPLGVLIAYLTFRLNQEKQQLQEKNRALEFEKQQLHEINRNLENQIRGKRHAKVKR